MAPRSASARAAHVAPTTAPDLTLGLDLGPAITALRTHRGAAPAWAPHLDLARRSLRAFCERYLAHHFSSGFCELHDDIFRLSDHLGPAPSGKRVARIAPRKFGKTTIFSLALPLQKLAFFERNFIILLGESATTAESNLATIAHELDMNERLLEDFPHLAPARDAKGQSVKWTDRQLIFRSRQTILAKGMAARMRGLKFRQMRPDLAIIDDPESPETADTFLKRQRHKRWFGGTFMGLGASNWDIVVIGNNPHHDCLIADLVRSPEWDGKLWRAENLPVRENERYPLGNTRTDGSALWPEVWSLENLAQYKREPNVGNLGYAREMLNDPRDEENKTFTPQAWSYFDFSLEQLRSYLTVATYMDPAAGASGGDFKRGKRDFCAIVSAGRTRDGHIDVFDVRLTRELPDRQLAQLLDVYQAFGARTVGVEENMYKNLVAQLLSDMGRKRGLYPNVRPITNHGHLNKITRIMSIQPLVEHGIVRFARHLIETVPDYFAQFDEFPGDYDDGPDATEGVISLLDQVKAFTGAQLISFSSPSYWRTQGT